MSRLRTRQSRALAILAGHPLLLAASLLMLVAVSLAAQQPARSGDQAPLDALVLVLNIISTTHARPVTGIVLARGDDAGPALVLVPAAFLSAGDEIIVLDGGTDILRDGRAARTVARSAETGVALLEVEGLQRAGIAIASQTAPRERPGTLQFAAWPAATALAEGAPLTRMDVRPVTDEDSGLTGTDPALPALSGPLLDACGHLAAWHVSGEPPRIVEARAVLDLAQSFGRDVIAATCGAQAPEQAASSDQPAAEVAQANTEPQPEPAQAAARKSRSETNSAIAPSRDGPGRTTIVAVLAAALLLALGVFLVRRERRAVGGPILVGSDADGNVVRINLGSAADGERTRIEHSGVDLEFVVRDGRLLVCDAGDDNGPLALVVAGTPCLPGERVFAGDGMEIRVGETRFVVRLDPRWNEANEGKA